jgi:hypothetical protein
MVSSALTSPVSPIKRTSGCKPDIKLLTNLLAYVMSQLNHIFTGRLILINQYQRLLAMHGCAAHALPLSWH